MNNIFVYLEIEYGIVSDVSLQLLTKGRSLANKFNCKLEALAIGYNIDKVESQVFPYGVDYLHLFDDKRLDNYLTLPYTSIMVNLFKDKNPQICLLGATIIGRDLGPRVSSALGSGLTADCTSLEIGDYEDKKNNKTYKDLLYQIRPAFGGNIIATIINPDCRPQMATVRKGVMKQEIYDLGYKGTTKNYIVNDFISNSDFIVSIIDKHIEKTTIDITSSPIIIAGGYGVGSKENFKKLFDLANLIGAEVGATRAAVDAGFVENERQIGQTGVSIRPKLYIACGISGQVQHISGMKESSIIISVNTDPDAPINKIADYVIIGKLEIVIPKIIEFYKKNTK